MKQEDKELLLKDLSARLLYGVKIQYEIYENDIFIIDSISALFEEIKLYTFDKFIVDVSEVKPYLFPLSSITEEQWMDTPYANLNRNFTFDSFKCGCSTLAFQTYEVDLRYVVDFINWCYKNHFDVNGLIPMGLAIDATNLKIY